MRTCFFRRISSTRCNSRNNGNFAREHDRRLLRKWPIANFVVFLLTTSHLIVRISPLGHCSFLQSAEPQNPRAVARACGNTGFRRIWNDGDV